MKAGRARAPLSPESEESWTVDCPCGVNFDDGEEMVDCDECGVWVHTICCHVLKGHTSYVCDNCKFKKRKESEECEVAQLLVELPSKATPLDEKVFTVPTVLSREERAHVQGVPGGDPSFFVGVSPVFSRQLWMCTGYIPKAFHFKYNDIPQERTGTCFLFAEQTESKEDNLLANCPKKEPHIDEGKAIDANLLPLVEVNTEKYYLSKEKHKRELKKEQNQRSREHHDVYIKDPYHNRRRRDESTMRDLINKRRSKKYSEDYHGTPRRAYDDATVPLKSARIASRNSKTSTTPNCLGEADAYNDMEYNYDTKVEELGSSSPGFSLREAAGNESSLRKHLATKTARKVVPRSYMHHRYEESNLTLGSSDILSVQEANATYKDHDGINHHRASMNKNAGFMLKSRDYFASVGHTEGKAGSSRYSHINFVDTREASQGARLNAMESIRDDLDGNLVEHHSHLVNEKINPGRNRKRIESTIASESDHGEHSSHLHNEGDDCVPYRASRACEVDLSDDWPLSDGNRDADLSLPEEVPKGKRKARRGRRLTAQSRGHKRGDHHGKSDQGSEGMEDEFDHEVSPFKREPVSSSEEEFSIHHSEIHHVIRHRGSSVDKGNDDDVDA
ncbi:hypothetical protein KP509_03G047800 [Ceratopteris richardii]|uniref:Zinc finger PHD-type domain-containing protein n=1 Tax=Ceratopteris richardii TaxID=49495 RepID=A0A8T2V6M2_CERRI|nr:hypothetical protein KP509_03G047800 [Ceratopteris richardii]